MCEDYDDDDEETELVLVLVWEEDLRTVQQ